MLIDPLTRQTALPRERIDAISSDLDFGPVDPCPSCGGTTFETIAERDRYGFPLRYVVCKGCDLVFVNPYYTDDALGCFYTRHYAEVYGRSTAASIAASEGDRGRRIFGLVGKVAARCGLTPSSVLDIGCSHGGILAGFPSTWLRVGYDYDETVFAGGRRLGLELNQIGRLPEDKRLFDVVMMNQVLEHTRDPVASLSQAATHLSQCGLLYIEVPGLYGRNSRYVDVRLTFKNAHRFHFSRETLRRCAEKASLHLVQANEEVEAFFVRDRDLADRLRAPVVRTVTAGAVATIRNRAEEPAWRRRAFQAAGALRGLTMRRMVRALRRRMTGVLPAGDRA